MFNSFRLDKHTITKGEIKLNSTLWWLVFALCMAAYPLTMSMLWPKVLLLLIVVFVPAAIVRFELTHPYVWMGFPFAAYYISTPILYDFGFFVTIFERFQGIDAQDMLKVLDVSVFAYIGFVIGCGPKRENFRLNKYKQKLDFLGAGIWVVWIVGTISALLGIYYSLTSSVETKQELILEAGWGTRVFVGTVLLYPSSVAMILHARLKGRPIPRWPVITVSILLLLGFLAVGQRGPLFKYLIMLFLIWHIFYQRVSLRKIMILGVSAMALATFMQGYKLFLVTYQLYPTTFTEEELVDVAYQSGEHGAIVYYLLGSEFRSASQNLAVAVNEFPEHLDYLYGKSLIWDVARVMVPSFLIDHDEFLNTALWFNREFYPSQFSTGSGSGFSLVAEGYINFGYAGAFFWFLLLGFAIRKLYKIATTNFYGLVFYIVFIPLMILSLRQDLASPLSQGLKHVAIPILAMAFIASIYRSISRGSVSRTRKISWRLAESDKSK